MSGMSRAISVLITCALSDLLDFSAQAMTIHVPADAPTIQAGVNSTAPGDTVEVACGTYTAGAVLKDGIVIRSETGLPGCVTIDVVTGTEAFRATDLSQGIVRKATSRFRETLRAPFPTPALLAGSSALWASVASRFTLKKRPGEQSKLCTGNTAGDSRLCPEADRLRPSGRKQDG